MEKLNWQLCPKCNGEGWVMFYRYINSTNANPKVTCNLCNGYKIISTETGLPPNTFTQNPQP